MKIPRLLGMLLVLALVMALAGSVWWYRREQPSPSPQSARAVRVLGAEGTEVRAIQDLVPEFTAKTGIAVTFDRASFVDAIQKGSQDFVNKTRLYDIQLQYNFSLGTYVENNWVLTLDEVLGHVPELAADRSFEDALFPSAWREVGFYRNVKQPGADPVAIGYPFVANTILLAYNQKLFNDPANRQRYEQKYGAALAPPTTWLEFRRVAEFFTDPARGTHGVAMSGGAGGWLYAEWCNVVYSMGGGVMKKRFGWEGDAQTPLLLTSPETVAATEYYLSLKPFSAGEYFTVGGAEQAELLKRGNVAMGLFWTGFLGQLREAADPDQFAFTVIPGDVSVLAGGAFFVSRTARHPREAAEFVMFLMQPQAQAALLKKGLSSAVRSAYDAPGVAELPWAAAVRDSLNRGVYMLEAGPDSQVVEQQVTRAIQRAWRGELTATEALREAEGVIRAQRTQIFGQDRP